ncbi:MAG: hypothetical protein K2I08_09870 [Muribaculaceae bacterium]|nr:hypothetical protein [Muribaculaceae bacterium]
MKRIISYIAIPVIFIIFAFWILAVKNGFMLRWYDEMSLFEPGMESLRQFLHYPGGIFRFAGTFLTQLLFYPALGASALILIWLICAWLTRISFRFSGAASALCYLIPFCMLASVLHLDEGCLSFESQGYVFYNSLGFTFSLGAYALFRVWRHSEYARGAVAILLPLLYPIAGFFCLLPALMCAIMLGMNVARHKKIIPAVFAVISIVLIVAVPLVYYRYFPGTTVDNDFLYLKGLPELTMNDYDRYLWQPFAIATAILLVFVIMSPFIDSVKANGSKVMGGCSLVLFCAGIIFCLNADSKKSEQLRATVLMINAIENHDWNKATHIMSLTKESPNYTMCVLDNLARSYCGKPQNATGGMMTVTKDFRHDEDHTIKIFVNVPVNYNIGRFNQSHRWATDQNVQYGNRVYYLKYIVRNAIMNGDMEFAKKFNRLLMRTMFHRKWAEDMNRYIEDPSLIPTLPDYDFLMALRAEEFTRGE